MKITIQNLGHLTDMEVLSQIPCQQQFIIYFVYFSLFIRHPIPTSRLRVTSNI